MFPCSEFCFCVKTDGGLSASGWLAAVATRQAVMCSTVLTHCSAVVVVETVTTAAAAVTEVKAAVEPTVRALSLYYTV